MKVNRFEGRARDISKALVDINKPQIGRRNVWLVLREFAGIKLELPVSGDVQLATMPYPLIESATEITGTEAEFGFDYMEFTVWGVDSMQVIRTDLDASVVWFMVEEEDGDL